VILILFYPTFCGSLHHGMARPEFADAVGGLHIWRVDTNVLNKQSWTAGKGRSSCLGVGRRATTPHRHKTRLVTKCYTGPRTCVGLLWTQ